MLKRPVAPQPVKNSRRPARTASVAVAASRTGCADCDHASYLATTSRSTSNSTARPRAALTLAMWLRLADRGWADSVTSSPRLKSPAIVRKSLAAARADGVTDGMAEQRAGQQPDARPADH